MSFETIMVVQIGAPVAPTTAAEILKRIPVVKIDETASGTFEAQGGSPPYSYAITGGSLPSGLSLGAGGALGGASSAQGYFAYEVTSTDSLAATISAWFSMQIDSDVVILNDEWPGGAKGIDMSVLMRASGGAPPYTWTVESGVIPDGLVQTDDVFEGLATGDASDPLTYTFRLRATDTNGHYAERWYTSTVAPPLDVSGSLADGFVGVAYASALSAVHGAGDYDDAPAVTWSTTTTGGQTGMPDGFAIDGATGYVFGVTDTAGVYTFNVVSTNVYGDSVVTACSIEIFDVGGGSADVYMAPVFCQFDYGGLSLVPVANVGEITVSQNCTLKRIRMIGEPSGSVVADVKKISFASYPTTGTSIFGGAKPTITSAQKYNDATLTSVTTSFSAGDVVSFSLDSVSGFTGLKIILEFERTP